MVFTLEDPKGGHRSRAWDERHIGAWEYVGFRVLEFRVES